MKKLFITLFIFLITIACSFTSQTTLPSTFNPNSLNTSIVQTADAALTQTATFATQTFTPTPTFINAFSVPSVTSTSTAFTGSFKPGDPTATPLGSEITDLNFIEGLAAYNAKDYDKAIQLMTMVIESNPELAPPYRYRAVAYWYVGDCVSAEPDVDKALAINPDYAFAWFARGLINECLGNYFDIVPNYEKALSLDPSLAVAHANLGVYYYGQGNYQKSLEEYTLSVTIDPTRSGAWSGRAEALFKLGLYEECIISATKALEINPEEWLAYSDRAFCQDFMGNAIAAIEDYKIYIEHADANATTWYNLGINQREIGDTEEAVISYTKALEIDPTYYPAHINRGNAYIDLEEYEKALDDFNSALEVVDLPNAYSGRGDAYYGLGRYSSAIEDYERAVSINPNNAYYYCMLSLSYFEIKNYQASIDAAQKTHQIDPTCGGQKLFETEARSYYGLKNYDQALVYINKALALGDYAIGHYYRGIIYQSLGKNQEAIQDLELFLSMSSSDESMQDEISDAKSRLSKLKN